MRSVILAAGLGRRLRKVVGDRPKCLARVGESSLLERQLAALREAGLDRVTIVTGFGTDHVRRACSPAVEIIQNARYASTNSLYSMWLARRCLSEGFLVLNCDVLFHPRLLVDLLEARFEDALLVCSGGDETAYSDEEMKVCVRRGLVTAIDKTLDADASDAESVGIAKFGPAGAAILIDELNRLVSSGAVGDWLPRAFASFCQRRPLHAVDSRGYPWIEIDFPEDYWRACSEIAPAIDVASDRHGDRSKRDSRATSDSTSSCPSSTTSIAAALLGRTLRHV